MRKIWLLPILLLFFLAACQTGGGVPVESRTETETDESSSINDAPPEESPAVVAPTDPLNNEVTIGQNAAEAGQVRERDWTKGAQDPLVTIIEYGDFQ